MSDTPSDLASRAQAREEVARVIADAMHDPDSECYVRVDDLTEVRVDGYLDLMPITDALLARWPHIAGPERVESVEELDALQVDLKRREGVVVRGADGTVYQRDVDNSECEAVESRHAWWWQMGRENDELDSTDIALPATVLYRPDTTNPEEGTR